MRTLERALPAALILAATGCAARDPVWDTPAVALATVGLDDGAVLVDDGAARAVVLHVDDSSLTLATTSVPTGIGFAAAAVTRDLSKALVLTRGTPPESLAPGTTTADGNVPKHDTPRLTVIQGGDRPGLASAYPLTDPLSGLVVDPLGGYAVVYASADDQAFVSNPNELVITDLGRAAGGDNPTPVTLRSFGGAPQGFTFTPELGLPGGASRLLVVNTDRDISILDLEDLGAGEATVRLSSDGAVHTPAQIAVTDGDPERSDDARLAVRLANEASVIFVDLLPKGAGDGGAHAFAPVPNEVFVGGVPSDVAFVKTDGGLRLAALVPSKQALTLADPDSGLTTDVALGAPYEHLSLVTDIVGSASGADVALLWSSSSSQVAFVALGSTVGKPYRSVDTLQLDAPVARVVDVPPPNDRRKILVLAGEESFSVLDLVDRTESPIFASQGSALTVSPDGHRAWLLSRQTSDIADLDLATLHPQNLLLANPVTTAFDVQRRDGGRALLAIDQQGAVDVTVLDGTAPSVNRAKEFVGVLLGGVK